MTQTLPSRGSGRAALLQAASAELREKGVANLSLRAIARRAGVSHAAPKHHFDDRAGLLTAVAIAGFIELRTVLQSSMKEAGADPRARFTAGARAYLAFGLENAELFSLMFRTEELDAANPELISSKTAAYSVLRQGVADGTEPSGLATTENLALISLAFFHGLVVLMQDGAMVRLDDGGDVDQLVLRLTAAFTETITRTIGEPANERQ